MRFNELDIEKYIGSGDHWKTFESGEQTKQMIIHLAEILGRQARRDDCLGASDCDQLLQPLHVVLRCVTDRKGLCDPHAADYDVRSGRVSGTGYRAYLRRFRSDGDCSFAIGIDDYQACVDL